MTAAYGVHRLSGIVTTANAMYSAQELEHQLRSSGSQALITCFPLLETALQAAKAVGLPNNRIFIQELPGFKNDRSATLTTVEDLVSEGSRLPELEPLKWSNGQGARQSAFLCYSSGTSGLPVSASVNTIEPASDDPVESSHDLTSKHHCQYHTAFGI
jgi:acyl-CoA synthetase (AMP-forming)/AMP-acid ligase II